MVLVRPLNLLFKTVRELLKHVLYKCDAALCNLCQVFLALNQLHGPAAGGPAAHLGNSTLHYIYTLHYHTLFIWIINN